MDARKIRENLGRVKVYYLKGETLRALEELVLALKGLGSAQPTVELRGGFREGVQMIARDDGIKKHLKTTVIYQPGKEAELLAVLSPVLAQMKGEAGEESHDVALARKQQLDQALNVGQRLLAQGKVSEADAAFQIAVKAYRNEHVLFQMLGKAMLEAGQPRRALPYLKRAKELMPESETAAELYAKAMRAKEGDTAPAASAGGC